MTVLTMDTVCGANEANSSTNVTQTHSKSSSIILSINFVLKNISSLSVVEVKISFMTMIVRGRRLVENVPNSDQVILQFAAKIFDLLLPFKMREELIEKKKLRLSSRNGASDARQIVQLAKCAGKGGLAALIGTGYDQYPLSPLQVEVVAYYRRLCPDKLFG